MKNHEQGLHTLFLLDLHPQEKKFMTISQALRILEKIEMEKKRTYIFPEQIVIGCARLGSKDFIVKTGQLKDIKEFDFGYPPYCLIIPGKMHFSEEEMLNLWK